MTTGRGLVAHPQSIRAAIIAAVAIVMFSILFILPSLKNHSLSFILFYRPHLVMRYDST